MQAKWRRLRSGRDRGGGRDRPRVRVRPQPVAVDVSDVERVRLVVTVEDEGKTRVHDIFVLSAPVTGRMHRIDLHVGDPRRCRDRGRADRADRPRVPRSRSEATARAEVRAGGVGRKVARRGDRAAQAELDFARRSSSCRELIQKNTISQHDLDEAERAYRTRRAALLTAQAELRTATRTSSSGARAAHVSGRDATHDRRMRLHRAALRRERQILQLLQQSEAVVPASTPLVEVGDPRDLEIAVDLLSSDASRSQPASA